MRVMLNMIMLVAASDGLHLVAAQTKAPPSSSEATTKVELVGA